MTDNFNTYRNYMQLPETEGGDAYYVIELVRRGKDNPDLPAANYHFKNYYIDTLAKYDKVQDEIRQLCRTMRLRAYVSVNQKSYKRVAMSTIAEMSRRAALGDFARPYAIFESCSGKDLDNDDKHWIVDVDDSPLKNDVACSAEYVRICDILNETQPVGCKVELILPTRSGVHIITRPFNVIQFQNRCADDAEVHSVPDIKKNHLTLLFEDL